MKSNIKVCLVVLVSMFFLSSCGQADTVQTEEKEKGTIDQMTDKAAKAAVKKIRTPIDKATQTQQMGDDRLKAMDKVLKESR